jgi:chemotaxis protein methyltransferase CheR
MSLTAENFAFIQTLARDLAAIALDPGKEYLVETRLSPLAEQAGFPSLNAFIQQLRTDRANTLFHDQVIDAMTTNETSFFRDFHPFEALRLHILPQIIEQRSFARRLTIWSAASSTGQEPYSLALLLKEHFPQLADWNVSILATDISATVLTQARQGVYSQLEVNRGLPAPLLIKYFTQAGTKWQLKDEVKKLVEFRTLNLSKPWPILPAFDLVLIRNVMIYFDVEAKKTILKRIRSCLQPHGHLFLGTAETTINLDPNWAPVTTGKCVTYQIAPAAQAVGVAA